MLFSRAPQGPAKGQLDSKAAYSSTLRLAQSLINLPEQHAIGVHVGRWHRYSTNPWQHRAKEVGHWWHRYSANQWHHHTMEVGHWHRYSTNQWHHHTIEVGHWHSCSTNQWQHKIYRWIICQNPSEAWSCGQQVIQLRHTCARTHTDTSIQQSHR